MFHFYIAGNEVPNNQAQQRDSPVKNGQVQFEGSVTRAAELKFFDFQIVSDLEPNVAIPRWI